MLVRNLRKLFHRFMRPTVELSKNDLEKSFSWLEKLQSYRFQDYIKKENRYANLQLLCTWRFQRNIKKRINQLANLEELDTCAIAKAEQIGPYIYYEKEPESCLPLFYRQHVNIGNEELVFDQNQIAKETGFVQVLGLKISTCTKYLAAIIKTNLSDVRSKCWIYKLGQAGPILVDTLPNVTNAEWCDDGKTLLLTTGDDFGVSRSVQSFCLQNKQLHKLIQEEDMGFQISILKSRDGRQVISHSSSKHCSEVQYLDAKKPEDGFKVLVERENGLQCFVDHWDNHFYALKNNEKDGEFQISKLSRTETVPVWHPVYSPTNMSSLMDMEIFADFLIAYELNNLIPQLSIVPFDQTDHLRQFKTANHPSLMDSFSNQNPHSVSVKYTVASPIEPMRVFELNRSKQELVELSGAYSDWDSTKFQCEIVEGKSKDGTNVPTTVYFRKTLQNRCKAPLFVTVYGSYGVTADLRFSAVNAFLLENGWILAFPHVRGGGEFGRYWHKQATGHGKRRTFEDLEASVQIMHSKGISSPELTVVSGMSAGGLAVAVLCKDRPELLKAAVLQVPFLDVLHSMMDENSCMTQQEYEEWGNPAISEDDFRVIKSYCPFQNLQPTQNSPSMYLTTSLDDARVPAWVPVKYMAKWRSLEVKTPRTDGLVLCRIHEDGGHFGSQKKDQQMTELVAFLYLVLDLKIEN